VGSNLCLNLLERGHKVICVDNLATGLEKNLQQLQPYPTFSFIRQDIIEPFDLGPVDEIYNLACPASPPQYQKDPIQTLLTSVWGTYNLLNLAKKYQARFLQASTSEVYGDPLQHPQKESYWGNVNPVGLRSNYDEGKRTAETLTMDFYRQYGLEVRIVRIFNTYGPNMDPNDGRVVSNFIVQALQNQPLTIYGDGRQTRSFQYVDDLISGMVILMNNTKNFLGPVNMGNPDEFTVLELAQKVLDLIPESRSTLSYQDLPQDDPKVRNPDISLAKKELGWSPRISLAEGLPKTIEYFRSKLGLM
jgi:UDP-glucuronate decarboxylase